MTKISVNNNNNNNINCKVIFIMISFLLKRVTGIEEASRG